MRTRSSTVTAIGPAPTNGGAKTISQEEPYQAIIAICGTADLLFHRWDCDEVKAKGDAAKNSKAKKTDNVESYVYRNEDGELCLPGEYLRQAIIHAAKFRQDPRSPRKSAMDLYKAGIISETQYASLGSKNWDYEHKCRVVIQRSGVTRTRPAFKAGWEAEFTFTVNTPEYIAPADLQDVASKAGKLIGVGDNRPSYGRFMVTKFEWDYLKD